MQKELVTEKERGISRNGIEHEFNINMRMNRLMLGLQVHAGQLSSQTKDSILDYEPVYPHRQIWFKEKL